jgi:hypothetical protein
MVSFLLTTRIVAFGKPNRLAETGYGKYMFTQEYSRSKPRGPVPQPWWPSHLLQATRAAEVMELIPADVEYRGNRIVWDARQLPGTSFWTGRAAVVLPADFTGVKRIYRIPDSNAFESEEAVRDHLIGAAKDWIDHTLEADPMDLSL